MNIKNLFMNLAQKVKALEYSLGLIADYVVERGTNSFWYYEKYESGILKAYGQTAISTAMTNALSNTYYGNATINVSALGLTELISINVSGRASGAYFATKIETYNSSTWNIQLSSRASSSNTTTVNYMLDIKGKWK